MSLLCPLCHQAIPPNTDRSAIRVAEIQDSVAIYFSVSLSELMSERTSRKLSRPRQTAMYFAHELTGYSLARIARCFNRDRTTISHGIANIEHLIAVDEKVRADIAALRTALGME